MKKWKKEKEDRVKERVDGYVAKGKVGKGE